MTITHHSQAALALAYGRRAGVEVRLPTWLLAKAAAEGAPAAGLAGQQRRAPAQCKRSPQSP